VFAGVVAFAERGEVLGVGRPALLVGGAVVEFAVVRAAAAAREGADLVAGDHEVGEIAGWPVGGVSVVEQVPGGRVGE
jgi:hypothetical protein